MSLNDKEAIEEQRLIDLINSIAAAGNPLKVYLNELLAKDVAQLIMADSEKSRGRIQLLQTLLQLPQQLSEELQRLRQELP